MKLILGTASPRRHQLAKDMGLEFEIFTKDVDETYPIGLPLNEVAEFLAKLKAQEIYKSVNQDCALITADTVVLSENKILGKPKSFAQACDMIKSISGKTHEVMTGVAIKYGADKLKSFSVSTEVSFHRLTDEEIKFYVKKYEPYDKAGAYGIQEWVGYIGIKSISGSFYNVMGLPTDRLYMELKVLGLI